ncbi:MAG: hypothetical protein WC737_05530 [Parcubacteria group bacterium]|jgi:hypothetical protein
MSADSFVRAGRERKLFFLSAFAELFKLLFTAPFGGLFLAFETALIGSFAFVLNPTAPSERIFVKIHKLIFKRPDGL